MPAMHFSSYLMNALKLAAFFWLMAFLGLELQRQSSDNIAHVFATLPRHSGGVVQVSSISREIRYRKKTRPTVYFLFLFEHQLLGF